MLAVPGYTIHKRLSAGPRAEVYAATRDLDRRDVMVKVYPAGEAARARRELRALRRAAGPGVVEALELDLADKRPVLVLATPSGVSLASLIDAPVEIGTFLRIAEAIGTALTTVHAAHVVHRDLHPAAIVVDLERREAHIIDFSSAAALGANTAPGPGEPTGSPAYMPPEQTGWIRQGVDFRSDLYALGGILFQLLTQRVPFPQTTREALIHAQLATSPPSPITQRPDTPVTIARIVLKLLQKQPEDRYQTVTALLVDLAECSRQLEATGTIADFPLARSDAPARPTFPPVLLERDAEIAVLRDAAARVVELRRGEMVWIRGAAGVGKTALIDALRASISSRGGYIAWGKFDQYRPDQPYAGIREALDSLVQQWLTEDDSRLADWRERLTAQLGVLVSVVAELVPDLSFVLGQAPPAPPVVGPREARQRLALAIERLLRLVAERSPSLVLVLDSLHQADSETLAMIERLATSAATAAVLVVGASRSDLADDEMQPLAQLASRIQDAGLPSSYIELVPLSRDAVATLVARALARSLEATESLADRLVAKTGGAPLLIQQLVAHLHTLGDIWYEAGTGWTWDDDAVAATQVPEGAVGLMVAKLEQIQPAARALLAKASCLTDSPSVEHLAARTEHSRDEIEAWLWELCAEGLIVPCARGYRFAHDRIRDAAQALLSSDERSALHATAARRLLDDTPAAELAARSLELAEHIQRAGSRLGPEVASRALDLCLAGARQAMHAGAPEIAIRYAHAAYGRLREADWTDRPHVAFGVVCQYADCAYQTQRYAVAVELMTELSKRHLTPLQQATVAGKQISLDFAARTAPAVLLQRILDELARFGVRWPIRPSRLRELLDLLWTDVVLLGGLRAVKLRQAEPTDVAWLPPVVLLASVAHVLLRVSPGHLRFVVAYCLREYARHGYRESPALALAGYASARRTVLGDSARSQRYAQAAEEWCRAEPRTLPTARAEYSLYATFYPWTRSRRDLLGHCAELVERALTLGDVEYAATSASYYALCSAVVGEPLDTVAKRYAALPAYGVHADHEPADLALELLRGEIDGEQLAGTPCWARLGSQLQRSAPFLATALCIAGEHRALVEGPLAITGKAVLLRRRPAVTSHIDYLFVYGLACASLAAQPGATRAMRRQIRACVKEVRKAARKNRDFEHMAAGLAAEQARLARRHGLAGKRYTLAAQLAFKRGYRHHAALLHERHARMLLELHRNTEALSLLRRAHGLYAAWGAHGKARELEHVLGEPPSGQRSHASSGTDDGPA